MDRKIFRYNNGEKDVYVDPTELEYQLARLDIDSFFSAKRLSMLPEKEDGSLDIEAVSEEDIKILMDSYHEAEPRLREAFGVRPFDRETGEGMLFREIINLYSSFISWRNELKKNTAPPPNSPPPTG